MHSIPKTFIFYLTKTPWLAAKKGLPFPRGGFSWRVDNTLWDCLIVVVCISAFRIPPAGGVEISLAIAVVVPAIAALRHPGGGRGGGRSGRKRSYGGRGFAAFTFIHGWGGRGWVSCERKQRFGNVNQFNRLLINGEKQILHISPAGNLVNRPNKARPEVVEAARIRLVFFGFQQCIFDVKSVAVACPAVDILNRDSDQGQNLLSWSGGRQGGWRFCGGRAGGGRCVRACRGRINGSRVL